MEHDSFHEFQYFFALYYTLFNRLGNIVHSNCSFFCLQGSSISTSERKHWPKGITPPFFNMANSKSLLERKDILAGTLHYGTPNIAEWCAVNLYSNSVICVYLCRCDYRSSNRNNICNCISNINLQMVDERWRTRLSRVAEGWGWW